MEKQWRLRQPDEQSVKRLTREIGCSPLIAKLLVNRGMDSPAKAGKFLTPSFDDLTPPDAISDMDAAVRRIRRALANEERILVFGDYDADGVTATALVVTFLRQCGARVDYHIPHRIAEGYGLGSDFIESRARKAGIDLIITVDCGSSSHAAIHSAKKMGIDTIVTDHHPIEQPPEDAVAVVNPARGDLAPDNLPGLSHLAGVGVAFYLVVALRAHLRDNGFWSHRAEPNLKQLCDLVALGTVADVSPLIFENRALTAAGLDQINRGVRPGIQALMRMSGAPFAAADTETIAFKLAPRINAAGRMAHARMACELLLTTDGDKAQHLAAALGRLNGHRREMESDLLEQILTRDEISPQPQIILSYGEGWHEGVLGIVASRLSRRFHCPALVLTTCNGTAKGSARSVEGIDITAALGQCADLLDRFGGHPLAAGVALSTQHLNELHSRLKAVVQQMAESNPILPTLHIDARLPLGDITPALMNAIQRIGPFGQGNPYPLFMDTDVRIHQSRTIGQCHRRMMLQNAAAAGTRREAVQFNVGETPLTADRFAKIAYRPQWNHWNGKKRLQLVVENAVVSS
jgi:single-stranded-DNA-specific exonuclease